MFHEEDEEQVDEGGGNDADELRIEAQRPGELGEWGPRLRAESAREDRAIDDYSHDEHDYNDHLCHRSNERR